MSLEKFNIPTPNLTTLRDIMVDEIFKAFGMSPLGWARHRLGFLFHEPTRRLAELGVAFDRITAESGPAAAMQYVLRQFVPRISFTPPDRSAQAGPLLVVSNHPGTFDALSIATALGRNDLKIVAGGIPFLQNLPNGKRCFIWAPRDLHERMLTIRTSIRHLQNGGAVLIFPSGHIDPDPDVLPGAETCLQDWSPSIEIMLRKEPAAQVQVAIVSGVLAEKYTHHPLVNLRKKTTDRQRIMEFMQVIYQLLHPGQLLVSPKISFSPPLPQSELPSLQSSHLALESLVERAKFLLDQHRSRPPQEWTTQTV